MSKKNARHRKTTASRTAGDTQSSPALYVMVLVTWAMLMGALYYSTSPLISYAWRDNPAIGTMVAMSILFIGYFWLSGLKDIFYTMMYHLRLKSHLQVPPVHEWIKPPRIWLLYCTYNDFDEQSAEICVQQDYPDYRFAILDDSTDPAYIARVYAFADQHPGVKVVRRTNRRGFKAGNLNNFLRGRTDYDYFVILDSDEKTPLDGTYIWRALDYFAANPKCGIVQANHRAARERTPFTELFARGVESHWNTYQYVKSLFGFMSLLGHGAMVSRECYEVVGGFPEVVAEDICFSIEALLKGFRTLFAWNVLCGEEFPLDYTAFTVRHNKWTQGNLEFVRLNTWKILFSKMPWHQKLDIVLFTYSLPLTAVFSVYMVVNAVVLPALGYRFVYPLWMLVPTVAFLLAPMLNDIVTFWGMPKGKLISYLFHSTLLYGSMYWTSLRASIKATFGGSTFLRTPKDTANVTFRETVRLNLAALVFAVTLASTVILAAGSILPVVLITFPIMAGPYLTTINQRNRKAVEIFV